ncbi:uncharacterized protein LOC127569165 [Pristis pectinata]|uniref:uncharacterized protein LOC127569165 n=1 Tax=Pristis pectinata TaxID=685728 RepID=UPI00223D553F|nr:uncharacterized protein LOC127569165 [Pristis pectinata]
MRSQRCSKIPAALKFSFVYVLFPSVFTQRSENHIYFLDKNGDILLKGPDGFGNGPVAWEWKPHSEQEIQLLGTFDKGAWSWWNTQWNDDSNLYQKIERNPGTIDLRIINPTFQFAGLFTLTQTQPSKKILKQYETFGISVEANPQQPVVGSDVTVSCTISRLPDTVSLQWEPMDLSQQNRRNTDQIRLNNTVYLMVRHVTVEDGKLYACEVRENGTIIHTAKAHFSVIQALYKKSYKLYRSGSDHSELHLICRSVTYYNHAAWTRRTAVQNWEKEIASALKYQHINVDRTYFGNRLVPKEANFNGIKFSMRVVPVLFEDAGFYTCFLESNRFVAVKLITVKVTAEQPNAVTEEGTVTLTCSVSDITESMRLVWINSDGKIIGEKTLNGEEKSLSLVIEKADRGGGNWKCCLFIGNRPQLLVTYYVEHSGSGNSIYFFHEEGNFVLEGPDNPGNGPIVWEWRPHTGQQTTKQLATFHREDQRWAVQWSDEYNKMPGISQRMHADWGTLNLRISKLTFELAGLFSWTQTQPSGKILRQWEVFGIKVEADSQRPVVGSDITLSCTISRLPDTVSLLWKSRGSSQQNRSNNTDQIHLNNTVYLMVRHVEAGNPNLYTWEVQENGSAVLAGDTSVEVDQDLHNKTYTVYRSDTEHSELDLVCEASAEFNETKWTWRSQHFQNQEREIASIHRSEPINVNRSYFGNRLRTTVGNVNGKNFNVRIVLVRFEDAGVYTCSTGSYRHVTIKLITVRVTAEPPDAVTEGDTITLTCSVSDVTESMRLVWINGDNKTIQEETFNDHRQEGKSLQQIIPKSDADRRKWMCAVSHQNIPKIVIPYRKENMRPHLNIWIITVSGYLFVKLAVFLGLICCLKRIKRGKNS